MKIQSLDKNIKSLIGDQSSYFIIPDYQRPYSWNQDNINDFWNDIVTAYENGEDNYFLGSLILIKNNDFEVVDGQQRLTTITIFLAVLRDYFIDNDCTNLANEIQDEFICKNNKYRLQVRPEDRLEFQDKILQLGTLSDRLEKTTLKNNFAVAVNCFYGNLHDKEEELKDNQQDPCRYFSGLYNYFMDKTLVVNIIAEDLSSAYTIFETINHRGEELETDELLKNFLLKRLLDEIDKHNRQNPQATKDFETEKQVLLEGYKYIKNISGDNITMQGLLRYHWMAMIGVKPKKDLYKEIINYIKTKNISSESFISEWRNSSDFYQSLHEGNNFDKLSDRTKNILCLMREIKHQEWAPVLIAAKRMNYSQEDFERLVYLMERTSALFWIAGYNTVKIKNPFVVLIRQYINKKKSFEEIEEYLAGFIKKSNVLSRFDEAIRGDCYGQTWCKYILAKYEYSLVDSSVIREICFNKAQIEHILPQTMSSGYWTNYFTEKEHDLLVDTIGNLALLIGGIKEKNKSKNQAASNKSFTEKIKVYDGLTLNDGSSAFQMVQDLKKYQDWTPEIIKKRSQQIIKKLEEEWGVTREEIDKEKLFSKEENLISSNELKEIKEVVAQIKTDKNLILKEVPDFISEDDVVKTKSGYIEESTVNLTDVEKPLCFGFWRNEMDGLSDLRIFIEIDQDEENDLKQLFSDQKSKKILIDWEFNDEDAHIFFCRANFHDKEKLISNLQEAYDIVNKYNFILEKNKI